MLRLPYTLTPNYNRYKIMTTMILFDKGLEQHSFYLIIIVLIVYHLMDIFQKFIFGNFNMHMYFIAFSS